MSIADIGRNQLRDALTGKMSECEVSEWLDDAGKPVRIFWRPLTGAQQKLIDGFTSNVERTCMVVKVRALDADGRKIFDEVPIESLVHDYEFRVIRAICYLMTSETSLDADELIGDLVKE